MQAQASTPCTHAGSAGSVRERKKNSKFSCSLPSLVSYKETWLFLYRDYSVPPCDKGIETSSLYRDWLHNLDVGKQSGTSGLFTLRAGQDHVNTVCVRYFWQGNYQIYCHVQCIHVWFWPTLLILEYSDHCA